MLNGSISVPFKFGIFAFGHEIHVSTALQASLSQLVCKLTKRKVLPNRGKVYV